EFAAAHSRSEHCPRLEPVVRRQGRSRQATHAWASLELGGGLDSQTPGARFQPRVDGSGSDGLHAKEPRLHQLSFGGKLGRLCLRAAGKLSFQTQEARDGGPGTGRRGAPSRTSVSASEAAGGRPVGGNVGVSRRGRQTRRRRGRRGDVTGDFVWKSPGFAA